MNVNSDREKSFWNCGIKDHRKHQQPKLTEEEPAGILRPRGPSILTLASLDNNAYGNEDKYDGVAFVLPMLVQKLL